MGADTLFIRSRDCNGGTTPVMNRANTGKPLWPRHFMPVQQAGGRLEAFTDLSERSRFGDFGKLVIQ
jgi:hypothetical protein